MNRRPWATPTAGPLSPQIGGPDATRLYHAARSFAVAAGRRAGGTAHPADGRNLVAAPALIEERTSSPPFSSRNPADGEPQPGNEIDLKETPASPHLRARQESGGRSSSRTRSRVPIRRRSPLNARMMHSASQMGVPQNRRPYEQMIRGKSGAQRCECAIRGCNQGH